MDPNKPISAQDLQLFETIWKRVGLDDDFDREAILRSKKSILDLIDESNELIHQSRGNLNKEVQLFTNHGNGLIKYFWKVEYDNKMGVDASFFFNKGQWMLSESKPLSSTKSTPPSHFQILSIFLKNAQNNESVDSNKIKEAQALINDKNTSINELEKFIQKLSWSDLGLSIDISWFNGETNKNTNGLELSPSPNDLIPEIPAFLGDLHLYGESTHKVPWNDPYALILVCDFLRSSGLEYESKDEQMANQIAKPLSRSHQSLRKVLDSNFSKINTTDLYSALVNYRLDEMTKIVKKQYISQNEDDKITIHKIIPLDSQKFPFGLYKFQGLPILKISKDDYDIIFESFTPLGEKHEIARIPLSSRRFKTLEQVDDHQFMIRSDQMEVPLEIYFPDSYTQRTKEVILFNIAYAFAQIPKSYLSLFKGDKNEDSIRVVFASQEKAKALGLDSKLPASGVYNPFNNTLWVALSEKTLEASSLGAPDIISTF